MRDALRTLLEALFRVLFTYDCTGEEQLPEHGPAVVAANHPSYLDPVLLSLQVRRPIYFMAWDALFKVPLVGWLIRLFGAFPVDIRRGRGQEAYERAKALLAAGHLVGLFPEGRRSSAGWMEAQLRAGAARLAWETGAPLVPATITGAFRAWPHTRLLPHPARIRVRYHAPIDPHEYRGLPEAQAIEALLSELRRRVERSLLPGVKADRRLTQLYRGPAPFPRLHETLPALGAALLLFRSGGLRAMLPAYAYLAYLFADHAFLPQRRFSKRLRNVSPVLFLTASAPSLLAALSLPVPAAPGAWLAVAAGALYAYVYERGRTVLRFVRGLVLALLLSPVAGLLAPSPLGPHVTLSLYAAAFAWERRTVFWRYSAPLLLAYAAGISWWLSGGVECLPHALAGLVAWLAERLLPGTPPTGSPATADEPPLDGRPLGL